MSFIVPALNEERNLEGTVAEIKKAVHACSEWEIVLIDDCSTDATGAMMDRFAAEDPAHIRAFHNERNLGLGGGYKRGIGLVSLDYLMWIPSDNALPASTIVEMIGHIGEADIVIPYLRDQSMRPLVRRAISQVFNRTLNVVFFERIRYHTGPVIHRTELIRQIEIVTDGPAYQAEALVKLLARGATYIQLPYDSVERGPTWSSMFKPKALRTIAETVARSAVERYAGKQK